MVWFIGIVAVLLALFCFWKAREALGRKSGPRTPAIPDGEPPEGARFVHMKVEGRRRHGSDRADQRTEMGVELAMRGLDEDGQPRNKAFNWERNAERDIAELIGICKGSLADGKIVPAEADYLRAWTQSHAALVDLHPFREIAIQLERMYRDGKATSDDLDHFQDLLKRVTGWTEGAPSVEARSSRVPLDEPPPDIIFPDKIFSLTGAFAFGPRPSVVAQILDKGGHFYPNPTLKTDYLVIGTFASRDWISTEHGRKIERALWVREHRKGHIAIVSEEHWVECLRRG
jgi:hypothetical protein